jgi:predicted acetyltransferase
MTSAAAGLVVRPAGPADRAPLQHMLELYQHDLSHIWPQDLDSQGLFGYALDRFLGGNADADTAAGAAGGACHAHLFQVGGHWAGFALVDQRVRLPGGQWWMDQFFVMKKYRRAGIGRRAALAVLGQHPGRWQVGQMPDNLPAQAFWRHTVAALVGHAWLEHRLTQGPWQGVVQAFTVAPAAAPQRLG